MRRAQFLLLVMVFVMVNLTMYFVLATRASATGMAVVKDLAGDANVCSTAADCAGQDACCTIQGKSFCTDALTCRNAFYQVEMFSKNAFTKSPLLFLLSSILITGSVYFLIIKPVSKGF
ncbi:MAG: hypothetical protein V1735_06040 [Nanoarchaeota archaeon]